MPISKIDAEQLRLKIESDKPLTKREKGLILRVICMNADPPETHTYPKGHGPKVDQFEAAAWGILDSVSSSSMMTSVRWSLGAKISEALRQAHHHGLTSRVAQPHVVRRDLNSCRIPHTARTIKHGNFAHQSHR